MNNDSKIVVFGASGLVGSAIVKKLIEQGYKNVHGTYFSKSPIIYPLSPITYHKVNLINQRETENFFKTHKPEYVFLAAAKVGGIIANNTYKADFIYDNIMIAANVIHAAYKYKVKKLLNLGSSCIYPKYAKQPMKEEYLLTGSLEPTNEPYAIAKIAAIKLCRYFNEQYGTNFMSVMPTNLYGPYDNFDLETSHVMPAVLRKMHLSKCLENDDWSNIRKDLNKRPIDGVNGGASKEEILHILEKYGIKIEIKKISDKSERLEDREISVKFWGSGNPFREFLYSNDMADACIFLMNNYDASDIGEFVNIGSGKDLRIRELVGLIKRIVGFKGKIEWDSAKPDGTPRKLLDVSRIKKLGWTYKTELEDGIKKYYEWYLSSLSEEN